MNLPGLSAHALNPRPVPRTGAANARCLLRSVAVPAGAGLLGAYAYGTAKYRRNARTTYDFQDMPAPDSAAFNRLLGGLSGSSLTQGTAFGSSATGAGPSRPC